MKDGQYAFDYDRPKSIGKVKGFYGNFGILVRAYAYILAMGGDGLAQVSRDAILAANYLRTKLADRYNVPHKQPCMHEFVISAARQKARGVSAGQIAKRLLILVCMRQQFISQC